MRNVFEKYKDEKVKVYNKKQLQEKFLGVRTQNMTVT